MAFCQNCGSKQPDESVFCDNCGVRLEKPVDSDFSKQTEFAGSSDARPVGFVTNFGTDAGVQDEPATDATAPAAEARTATGGFFTDLGGNDAAPNPVVPTAPPASQPKPPKEVKEKKPINVKKIVLLLTLAIVIVVGAIVGTSLGMKEIQKRRTYQAELALGERYLEDSDYESAVLSYSSVLDIAPKDKTALLGYADANAGVGDMDAAEEAYREYIEAYPDEAVGYERLTDTLIGQDKQPEAKSAIEDAVARPDLKDNVDIQRIYDDLHPKAPGFSLPGGSYSNRNAITITAANGSAISYTMDGSDPAGEDALSYMSPIILPNGKIKIRAIAISGYGIRSAEASVDYDTQIADAVITFVDRGMEDAVRRILNKGGYEDITNGDVAGITSLSIVGSNADDSTSYQFTPTGYIEPGSSYQRDYIGTVATLEDLRYMPFLQSLRIAFQESVDISALQSCGNLQELSLIHVNLSTIAPLGKLIGLKRLCIGWNAVSDITSVANMTKLTHLGLWGNQISDISAVIRCTELEYLDVSDNQIKSIAPTGVLAKLREFWCYGNQISDFTPLLGLNELQTLMVVGNPVQNSGDTLSKIYPRLKKFDLALKGENAQ